MRLLIDGEVFVLQRQGGISRIYSEILPRLAVLGDGISVQVLMRSSGPLNQLHAWIPGVKRVPAVPRFRPWRLWRAVSGICDGWIASAYWRTRSADVFHPTYYSHPPVRCPSFCVAHDMIHELFPADFAVSERKEITRKKAIALGRASVILCISENTRRDVIRLLKVPEGKCRVVYPAGFSERLRGAVRNGAGHGAPTKPFLLYVGDWRTAYKNFSFVARCLGSRGFSQFSEYDLVVAGARRLEQCDIRLWDQLIPRRVRFLTSPTDTELANLYATCSALVHPSLYEGFGIPVAEALSMGSPVVCSMAASLPEVAGDAAYYFDPRSPGEFRLALERAISDGRRQDLVERRRNQAALFSWDGTAQGFAQACREIGGA
ncbi:MAG: glycosyltransferase family 1 protein [Verrucomicrobiota bacterium]|nr:glycosyltransferase family 1 protein [Verrucomicrobiota bacterium]